MDDGGGGVDVGGEVGGVVDGIGSAFALSCGRVKREFGLCGGPGLFGGRLIMAVVVWMVVGVCGPAFGCVLSLRGRVGDEGAVCDASS